MSPFVYTRPSTLLEACTTLERNPRARIMAGGTNLVDLLKTGAIEPDVIVDLSGLSGLNDIVMNQDGQLTIGALARNSHVADNESVKVRFPLLSDAINAGATAQLRNAATVGGNILQSTRCPYFFDASMSCTLRNRNDNCQGKDGVAVNRILFGDDTNCCASYQSDMASALLAYSAQLIICGSKGKRSTPLCDFYIADCDHLPSRSLALDEIITHIIVPPHKFGQTSAYVKVRERSSFAFATVAVSAALEIENDRVVDAKLVGGSVAHKPQRLLAVESALVGATLTEKSIATAADFIFDSMIESQKTTIKAKLFRNSIIKAVSLAIAKGTNN